MVVLLEPKRKIFGLLVLDMIVQVFEGQKVESSPEGKLKVLDLNEEKAIPFTLDFCGKRIGMMTKKIKPYGKDFWLEVRISINKNTPCEIVEFLEEITRDFSEHCDLKIEY